MEQISDQISDQIPDHIWDWTNYGQFPSNYNHFHPLSFSSSFIPFSTILSQLFITILFHPFYPHSPIFILHPLLSVFIHFHSFSFIFSTFIHIYPCSSIVIHCYQLSICFYPLSSTIIHYYPDSFIHLHPVLPTFIYFHPMLFFFIHYYPFLFIHLSTSIHLHQYSFIFTHFQSRSVQLYFVCPSQCMRASLQRA